MSHPAEAFFAMPKRLPLRFEGSAMTGVVQNPREPKYQVGYLLCLAYRGRAGAKLFPVQAKPARVSYRHWLELAFGQQGETRMCFPPMRGRIVALSPSGRRALTDWFKSPRRLVRRGMASSTALKPVCSTCLQRHTHSYMNIVMTIVEFSGLHIFLGRVFTIACSSEPIAPMAV